MSVVVALMTVCAVGALAAPAFERVAPNNTVGVVAIHSIPELRASFEGSNAQALWREPSVQAFFETPKARLQELLAEQEGKVGVTLDEVLGLLQGQFAIVVWGDGLAESENVGVVCMIEVGEQGDKAMEVVKAICNAIAEQVEEGPLTFVDETYGGARLVSVRPNVEQGAEFDETEAFIYGVSGDVLLMGGPVDAVKRTVDSLAALPAVSLADNESYKAVIQKISPDSNLYGYVNVTQLMTTIRNAMQAEGEDVPEFDNIMQALGLDGVDAAGFGAREEKEYGIFTGFLRVIGEPRGIPKILMPVPGPLHTGEGVPANADTFYTLRLDPASIWDEVQRIIAGISPDAMIAVNAQLDQLAAQLGEPFDLRNDLLSVFGPRVAAYSWYEKPYTFGQGQKMIVAIDVASKAAFDNAYQKLQRLFPEQLAMFQQKDYMGYSLYSMEMPGMEGMAPPEMPELPAFAVTENAFILSPKVSNVQAHLRGLAGGGDSLAKLPAFQEAMQSLPAEGRIAAVYSDGRDSTDYILTLLREGQLDMFIQMFLSDPDIAELVNLFDFGKLPPSEDVTKHMAPAGGVVTVGPDGLTWTTKGRMRPLPQ
jgi:hypothetical protein